MRKDLIVLLVLLMCVLNAYGQAPKPFVSDDGLFSVVFPGDAKEVKFKQTPGHGDFGDYESKVYSLFLNHHLYSVLYFDYPKKIFQYKSIEKIRNDGLADLKEKPDVTISNVKNITIDGYPSISYDSTTWVSGQLDYARSVLVIAGARYYLCDFSSLNPADRDDPGVQEFLASFHTLIRPVDKPFASKDGRFSIVFPAHLPDPAFSAIMRRSEYGDSEAKQYSIEVYRGNWTMQYYDYPKELFRIKTVPRILDDVLAGIRKDPERKISLPKHLTVDGFPAIAFDFEMPFQTSRFYGRSVIVIAKPRVYNYIFTSADRAQLNETDVLRFFSSFHIHR